MDPQKPPSADSLSDPARAVTRCAAECAQHLDPAAGSFAANLPRFERHFNDLIDAIRRLDNRFAFDREGRPAAVAAIRAALPAMERDILDAVFEDHACEIAAVQEALYQIALARGPGGDGSRDSSH